MDDQRVGPWDAVKGCTGAVVGVVETVTAISSAKKNGFKLVLDVGEPKPITVVTTVRRCRLTPGFGS